MADLSKHGLVFHDRDEELQFDYLVWFAAMVVAGLLGLFSKTAAADGELTTVDDGEHGWDAGEGDLDSGEIGEDFEDGAARAGRVVEVLIKVGVLAELPEALSVGFVFGVVGAKLEEIGLRDSGDVEIVGEELAEGAVLEE